MPVARLALACSASGLKPRSPATVRCGLPPSPPARLSGAQGGPGWGGALPHRWCLRDERPVSTVVFGASSAEQVAANVAAVSLSRQLDEATLHAIIDALSATAPRARASQRP